MFYDAVKIINLEGLRSLLVQYPDVPLSENTIRKASKVGSIPIFKELFEKDQFIIHVEFQRDGTPLTAALLAQASPGFISYLLSLGADPNLWPNNFHLPPIACAASFSTDGSMESIDLLLKKGANLQRSGALYIAATKGHAEVTEFLLDHGARPKSDPPSSDKTGNFALNFVALNRAVQLNHMVVVCLLLEYGADVSVPDHTGRTALQIAEERGDRQTLELLRTYKM